MQNQHFYSCNAIYCVLLRATLIHTIQGLLQMENDILKSFVQTVNLDTNEKRAVWNSSIELKYDLHNHLHSTNARLK